VSAQIKALEDELGVALFERVSSGMVLTSAGRRLLPEAHKVVAAAQSLRSRARAIQGQVVGRASVGTVSDPEFVRVGEFLVHALVEHPLLEIEIHHEVTGEAFEKVPMARSMRASTTEMSSTRCRVGAVDRFRVSSRCARLVGRPCQARIMG